MRTRVPLLIALLLSVGFATPAFADGAINLQTIKRGDKIRVPAGETGVRVMSRPRHSAIGPCRQGNISRWARRCARGASQRPGAERRRS
jgi:hypothetical protein